MATWTNGWVNPVSSWGSTTITTSGTSFSLDGTFSSAPVARKPKVKSALDWLADEVDAICALTRVAA